MANDRRWADDGRRRRDDEDDRGARARRGPDYGQGDIHGGRRHADDEDERAMPRGYRALRGPDYGQGDIHVERRHADDGYRGAGDDGRRGAGDDGRRGAVSPDRFGYGGRSGGEISTGGGNEWERRAYGSHPPGPHRGAGPKGYRRSDERIREDVCDGLTEDPDLDAGDIEVAVAAGEVTLSGTVASRAERRAAEDLAEQASGVTHVQNNLKVRQPARPMSATGQADP